MSRPYSCGLETYPVKKKYPQGPYKYLARVNSVQTGFAPTKTSTGTISRVEIWDFGENTMLYKDTLRGDYYFQDVSFKWEKNGDLVVFVNGVGQIQKYSHASGRWHPCIFND